ncbi:MAG: HEAT repeat domain-containing protein [Gammaproteobacteria bacterium]|nr:HEAT repeat domain-containing protein [Gammaproteobacteria bacterium]
MSYIILLCCSLNGCTDPPLPTIHEQLRQHILEAELGSAITISFAKKPAVPLPAKQDETTLVQQLKANDKETRWAAAEKLAYSANKEVVLALISAMNDKSGTQRVCVMAQALGHLKDPRALSALTRAAFDPYNQDLRLCAIRSIGMIGDKKAVPDLIKALEQNNTPIQTANTLARLGDSRAVQPLIKAADNQAVRPWMIRALGELGNTEAVTYLTGELAHDTAVSSSKQQKLLKESLWKISILSQYDTATALSQVLLNNHEPDKRMWAAYRLGESKDVMSVYNLISSLQDNNGEVAGRAAAALVRMKAVSLLPVRSTLNLPDNKTSDSLTPGNRLKSQRSYLYAVLGYIGNNTDIKKLQSSLHNDKALDTVIAESLQLLKNGV